MIPSHATTRTLADLQRELETFRAEPCGISHERVRLRGGVAARESIGGEQMLSRIGLCDWTTRSQQLACAHTTARVRLIDVIHHATAAGALEPTAAQSIERRAIELGDVVQLSDWSKGELESAYALAIESCDEPKATALKSEIDQLERRHADATAGLQHLVDELRRALAKHA